MAQVARAALVVVPIRELRPTLHRALAKVQVVLALVVQVQVVAVQVAAPVDRSVAKEVLQRERWVMSEGARRAVMAAMQRERGN